MTQTVVVNGGKLKVLSNALKPEELALVLDGVGALLATRFKKSWRLQASPSGAKWGKRMTPNVPGIVADLNAGGNPKARRFTAGQALVDTGRLRNSITWEVEGNVLTVGTSVSYAKLHNEGGTSTVTLSAMGREKLKVWLQKSRRRKKKHDKAARRLDSLLGSQAGNDEDATARAIMARLDKSRLEAPKLALGWLFSKPSFTVKVRKRTFIEAGAGEAAVVRKFVEKFIVRRARAST